MGAIILLTLAIMHAVDMLASIGRPVRGRQLLGAVGLVAVVTIRIIQRTMEGTL